jgi:hypothetical protein
MEELAVFMKEPPKSEWYRVGRSFDLLVLWIIKKIPQLRVKILNF